MASWDEQVKIVASDAAASDSFGNTVAIDGDYAIVGAYFNDDPSNSGSAYILKKGLDGSGNETWTQQVKLVASDAADDDRFGQSVAISGNYAVVGAYKNDDNSKDDSGSAYIFKKDEGAETWTQKAKLLASDANTNDYFGYSVNIDGDYVIIGAYKNDGNDNSNNDDDSGSAYIFKKDEGAETWTEQAILTPSDTNFTPQFGYSVAISGNYSIIGANLDSNEKGAAYIFKKDEGAETWTQKAKLTASDAANYDHFGNSVDIDGDYTIIGAYWNDDSYTKAGSAYIFKKDEGAETWTEQIKLLASNPAIIDMFGQSVSINLNYAIIGAPYHDANSETNSGGAFIFKKGLDGSGNETWTELTTLTASDAENSANLGIAVSINGNYAIVGAYADDANGESNSGASYIFKLTGDSNVPNPNKPVGVSKSITIYKDSTYTFTANDISGNDGDGHAITKFKITQLPAKGTFEVSGNAITLNQEILAADVTNITYLPVSGEIGNDYANILYKPHDGQVYAENNATINFHVIQDPNEVEALNSGLSSYNTDKIKNTTISQNGAETNVFADKFIKNVSQRHSAIKLLFSKNASITKTKISRKDLKLTPNIRKEKVMVHKPKTTATVAAAAALVVNNEVDADTGIYANLADVGDAIKFKAHSGATDVVFTKTATGYTASTSGDTVWQAGDRYTFENVSYYFD